LPDQEQDIRKAPDIQVIVDGLVDARHENLKDAKILCFWTKKPLKSGGRAVAGNVKKVSDAQRVFFGRNIHFIITVSEVNWKKLEGDRQSAAIDELLCACWMKEGNPSIVPPDFSGYIANLLKYGFHQEDGDRVAEAAQKHIPGLEAAGKKRSAAKKGAGSSALSPTASPSP